MKNKYNYSKLDDDEYYKGKANMKLRERVWGEKESKQCTESFKRKIIHVKDHMCEEVKQVMEPHWYPERRETPTKVKASEFLRSRWQSSVAGAEGNQWEKCME